MSLFLKSSANMQAELSLLDSSVTAVTMRSTQSGCGNQVSSDMEGLKPGSVTSSHLNTGIDVVIAVMHCAPGFLIVLSVLDVAVLKLWWTDVSWSVASKGSCAWF